MKIAIPVEGKQLSSHFGYCEGFNIYIIENKEVVSTEYLQNPGHKPGLLPRLLGEAKVNVVVAGGMGSRAQELFAENGIEVLTGAAGIADEIIKEYIKGNIVSTGEVCSHDHDDHDHDHENCSH
ncbi:NifB/NifX family molybdenum-iron cluster-binding protein [Clostridiaceae bacterium M8S5]|nr:NifB/NifX family molybdenum-iron cluster-binding protein [Clostridiaceae bacterium M8S5]